MPILPNQGETIHQFVPRAIAKCRDIAANFVPAVFNGVVLYISADSNENDIVRIYDVETALGRVLNEMLDVHAAIDRLEARYQQVAPPRDVLEGLAIGDVLEFQDGGDSSEVTHIGYGPDGIVAVWGEGDGRPWVLWQDGTHVEDEDPAVVSVRRKADQLASLAN